jgi:hypothetical protein
MGDGGARWAVGMGKTPEPPRMCARGGLLQNAAAAAAPAGAATV